MSGMTWTYVLKRLFLLPLTLVIVILIAFFLKQSVPGDPVEAILINRGLSLSDLDKKQADYERIYKEEGLHLPLFYFSLQPSHYPKNIHSITDPAERNQTKSLARAGYQAEDIRIFLSFRQKMIADPGGYTVSGQENFDVWYDNPEEILSMIQNRQRATQNLPFGFAAFLKKMTSQKQSWSLPCIAWHGISNQFHLYLSGIFRLNFGTSMKDGKNVSVKIASSLRWTLAMILPSMIILFGIAIPLGLFSGRWEGSLLDRMTEKITILLYAIPVFWLATMLIIFCTSDQYASWLNIFPAVGTWYNDGQDGFFATVFRHGKQLILPVLCIVANDFAFLIKLIRENTIAQKKELYVKVAISKGLDDKTILFSHVLPNVGINILSVAVGMIPAAFAGSLIVEVIFNIPGMGRLLYNSIEASDWNVVFGILIFLSAITITANLFGDLLYARLNPKIFYHGKS